MSKHTPGPWAIKQSDSYPNMALLKRPYAGPQLFSMEDAKLIAAAPEMAEALRSVRNLLDQSPATGARVSAESAELALSIAGAALAKAGL